MLTTTVLVAAVALASTNVTDPLAPRPNGPRSATPTRHLIDNATVHTAPGETLDRADILIENGRIVRVGASIDPDGARVWDAEGLHVYAGFIDAYVPVDTPVSDPGAPGTHWNPLIGPQRDALRGSGLPESDAKDLRKLGFGAAAIAPADGIMRGWGAVVSTAQPHADPSSGDTPIHRARAFQAMGFATSNWSSGTYPTSHMGVMALLRQSFIDANHRAQSEHADANALDHIDPGAAMIYDTRFPLEALLADKVANEFGHESVAFVGSGTEYKRLDAFADIGRPMIVPLAFPEAPDVWSVGAADATTLDALRAWEQAPANARWLHERGVPVSITSSKLPKKQKLFKNIHRAIDAGLDPEAALAMLTTHPAELLGLESSLGAISAGMHANMVVASDDLFAADDATILDVWIDGRRHRINDPENTRFDGAWAMLPVGSHIGMRFEVDDETVKFIDDEDSNKARKVSIEGDRISFTLDVPEDGSYVHSGVLGTDGVIRGTGIDADQEFYQWIATRDEMQPVGDPEDTDDANEEDALPDMPAGSPFGAYTVTDPAEAEIVILANATVWTQSDDGILENAWVLINNGKIGQIGTGGMPRIAARIIDASGMHITPGLIDAHSHTGLFRLGVNEAGQAVTSECRIADSLDPSHINWYRQLAGGVTTANLLHGSANPIGGQSQTVKVRWGANRPEDMHFEGAMPGIKFALGENVKQSNWGDNNTTRYPQTRLGVETIIRDRFTKAREYEARGRLTEAGAKDLELEALAEILAGERLIHCHSYRQDEILMLCRVAEDFGFTVGTFQHGLETYKVAEIVREHAIGASLFSDWWAYKVEVQDAIPAAGPINFEAGLLTSYNSDSDDLARRMNVEAGKAYKYARDAGIAMTPQQALDFVTLNPAIQLGISERVGSIEVGKDADLAVWTGNPLSSMSRCVRTFVDGRELFSLAQDEELRDQMQTDRVRLINMILAEGRPDPDESVGDEDTNDPDDLVDPGEPETRRGLLARMYQRTLNEHIDHGTAPGECGCNLLPWQSNGFDD